MKRTFVTTDTHGYYDELKCCLDQANFDYENDVLIHCGDIVDRGPKVKELVDLLLSIKNLIPIKGNHDDWWLELLTTGFHPVSWIHGGEATRDSYLVSEGMMNVPQPHRELFRNQILYYIDDQNRFFTHAGYNKNFHIEDQNKLTFYWDRELFTQAMMYPDNHKDKIYDINNFKRVFLGHNQTIQLMNHDCTLKNKPIYKGQYVFIDTGGSSIEGKISLLDITDDDNHILYQNL